MTNPVEQPDRGPIGPITSVSAATGSQTSATFQRNGWVQIQPNQLGQDQQWVVQQYNNALQQDPNAKIYSRTGTNTASVTGGPSGVPTSSGSSPTTDYYVSNCAPGATGSACRVYGNGSSTNDDGGATQNGQPVDENTVAVGTVNMKFTSVNKPHGANENMQYVTVGRYAASDLNATVTATSQGASSEQLPNGLWFNPNFTGTQKEGYFFTGTATPAGDMTGLRQSATPVTGRYTGIFNGEELTNTTRRGVYGQTELNANFGSGAVTGNIYRITPEMNCPSQPCSAPAPTGYNININGTISGSQYSGTAQYATGTSSNPTSATGLAGTGNVVGGFFGPQAAETAGAVRVNGAAPGVAGTNTTVIGGYGARKQ